VLSVSAGTQYSTGENARARQDVLRLGGLKEAPQPTLASR